MTKHHILVTGHAGFIGSTLVEQLLHNDEYVIGIDCFSNYYSISLKTKNVEAFNNHPHFMHYPTTVQNQKDGYFDGRKISYVIHLASFPGVQFSFSKPEYYIEHNINGTVAALEIARKHNAKFIFASSSSVYGNGNCLTTPFVESQTLSPISIYGETKLSGEQFCEMYHRVFGLDVYCLRIFTCYGPRQRPDLAIRKFAKAIQNNEEIELRGDGSTCRDYTYVTDIVDGIIRAKERVQGFDIINLGNNKPIPLSQVVEKLATALNAQPKILRVPIPTGDVLHTCADIGKAKSVLDWQPQVDFNTGIERFITWFRENR